MPVKKKKKKSILSIGGIAKGRKVGVGKVRVGDEREYTKKKVSRRIAKGG